MLVASVPMNELIRVRSMTIPFAIPRPRPVAAPAISPSVGEVDVRDLARDDARDAHVGADREVEDAGDDADRLPAREQPDRRPLVEDVRHVLELQERRSSAKLSAMKSAANA